MPRRPIHKMPREQRAKQFAPFRALIGLDEALSAEEFVPVSRPVLSEEAASELNLQLLFLEACLEEDLGILTQIVWYSRGRITKKTGRVYRIDPTCRYLYWDQSDPLYFDDLLSLAPADSPYPITSCIS